MHQHNMLAAMEMSQTRQYMLCDSKSPNIRRTTAQNIRHSPAIVLCCRRICRTLGAIWPPVRSLKKPPRKAPIRICNYALPPMRPGWGLRFFEAQGTQPSSPSPTSRTSELDTIVSLVFDIPNMFCATEQNQSREWPALSGALNMSLTRWGHPRPPDLSQVLPTSQSQ
jgi:hypothetical protein